MGEPKNDTTPVTAFREALRSQLGGSMKMLEQAIGDCPDDLWIDGSWPARYWHLAYHALFYLDLYLSDGEDDFTPREYHRDGAQRLGVDTIDPVSAEQLLRYLEYCRDKADHVIGAMTDEDFRRPAPFEWLRFSRAENHLYNARHLSHHVGQLGAMLRRHADIGVGWVGRTP